MDEDDTLALLFLCCHPSLSTASQLALTLRAVGGLTTREIASALLVPEPAVDEAPTAAETDWRQILALYEILERVSPGPVVTLNRAVALAMVRDRGLAWPSSRRSSPTST